MTEKSYYCCLTVPEWHFSDSRSHDMSSTSKYKQSVSFQQAQIVNLGPGSNQTPHGSHGLVGLVATKSHACYLLGGTGLD